MVDRTRSHHARGRTGHEPPRRAKRSEDQRALLSAIAGGELDDHLGALAAAIDARRHLLHTVDSSNRLATLRVGDRVRVNDRVSPRYLAGLDATVIEIDDHAAMIRLEFPVGRFKSGRVRCPPLALEKLG
jgi:hypothetical protein